MGQCQSECRGEGGAKCLHSVKCQDCDESRKLKDVKIERDSTRDTSDVCTPDCNLEIGKTASRSGKLGSAVIQLYQRGIAADKEILTPASFLEMGRLAISK